MWVPSQESGFGSAVGILSVSTLPDSPTRLPPYLLHVHEVGILSRVAHPFDSLLVHPSPPMYNSWESGLWRHTSNFGMHWEVLTGVLVEKRTVHCLPSTPSIVSTI